jgi:prepilin-type N-terminal cleavage/methylation domain-containing protein/prepilin-type processing-associated H-X9-DG protein
MKRSVRRTSPARPLARGFTLVELLVVIGIIALLISILLPTLSRARESANAVKCASNQRQAATAMILYANESNGFLAGPHTSGAIWNYSPNADGNAYGGDSIDPGEGGNSQRPVQNMDWMSPTLGLVLGDDLPGDDVERLRELLNNNLLCPTVAQEYTGFTSDSGGGINIIGLNYGSYAAVIQFHAYPRDDYSGPARSFESGSPEFDRVGISSSSTRNSYEGVLPPPDYTPKLVRVGNNSTKAYLIEGPRYTPIVGAGLDAVASQISFNDNRYQRQGGNFMARGPYRFYRDQPHVLTQDGDDWNGGVTKVASTLGWRHNEAMNLAFFDGHVERRRVADSIQVDLYFPEGSILDDASETWDPDDVDGSFIE